MKNKTKKRHSFIGNTIYMLKLLLKQDCSALPHCVLYDIGTVLMELNVVSFVTALTYCFENSKGIKAILLVLLDGSTVAEVGTHEELMSRKGKYAEMFDIQSQYYKEEADDDGIEE